MQFHNIVATWGVRQDINILFSALRSKKKTLNMNSDRSSHLNLTLPLFKRNSTAFL